MSDNFIIDPVVQVLENRITDEDFDFQEAAQAVVDALRLREQWSFRTATGETGWQEYDSKEQVTAEAAGVSPQPLIVYRVVSDWRTDG